MPSKLANQVNFKFKLHKDDELWENQERAVYRVDVLEREMKRRLEPEASPSSDEFRNLAPKQDEDAEL